MNGDDRTVQVPVSLPTREQIAEALWREYRGGPYADWSTLTESDKDEWRAGADAMLALLPQPTPTAGCAGCAHRFDVHAEHGGRGEGCELCMCLAFQRGPSRDAEPPRIEDMAPGTTFRARFHWDDADREFKVDEWGHVRFRVWQQFGRISAIDPSTIRDVRPPKDAS